MKAYKLGNTLVVNWVITNRDGSRFPLSQYPFELCYITPRGRKVVDDTTVISVIDDILVWDFTAEQQIVSGPYSMCLKVHFPGGNTAVFHSKNQFMLSKMAKCNDSTEEVCIYSQFDE